MENNANDLFVQASRLKLTFALSGTLVVDDLWDVSLDDLNREALRLDALISPERKTFLDQPDARKDKEMKLNELRLEILKYVMRVRQDEAQAKKEATIKESQRLFYQQLLEKRRLNDLESLSVEEIQRKIEELG